VTARLTSFEARNSLVLALRSISLSDDGGNSSTSFASHIDIRIDLIYNSLNDVPWDHLK